MAIIAHIDLDAFFASVEERDKPYLRGMPIVIGADPNGGAGRGVVSTANYAARRYGIHSAQPIRDAWRRSENARQRGESPAAFLSVRSDRYKEVSDIVFSIVRSHVRRVECTSIDEAYLDLSHLRSYRRAKRAMLALKEAIHARTKLTCSVGIGKNRMVAKIASNYRKPDGITVITPAKTPEFLAPLPVDAIPGVGKKTVQDLHRRGIKTVSDVRKHTWNELESWFGAQGLTLFERSWGNADTTIGRESKTKSIGKHDTFTEDTWDMEYVFSVLTHMADHIAEKLSCDGFIGFRTVVLTIRFSNFTTVTRSLTAAAPLKTAAELEAKAIKLALPFFDHRENPKKQRIRLVGLRVEKLV